MFENETYSPTKHGAVEAIRIFFDNQRTPPTKILSVSLVMGG